MTLLEQAKQQISADIKQALGITVPTELFSVPPKAEMGDIALPCFTFAKEAGKSPVDLAKDLAAKLAPRGVVAQVKAFGPYVNFYLAQQEFGGKLLQDILKKKTAFGRSTAGKKRKVLIEYANQNTHKEIHVGHMRNFIFGSAAANLLDALGFAAVRISYINDYGSFVPKTLWAFQHHPDAKQVSMGALYAFGATAEKENPQAQADIKELLKKFQIEKDKKVQALWKKTRTISIGEFKKIYKELGMRFDAAMYESEYVDAGRAIVDDLMAKGILKKSQGAIIADLTDYGLDVLVVIRTDGTSQYAVADLAATLAKFKKYKPSRAIWVVDVRQQLYFKQLFKILELMGVRGDMQHLGYEYVQLTTGALASRTGNVLTYWDVRDQLVAKSIEETTKRHADWNAKKCQQVGTAIALAALKFGMLKQQMHKVVTFDIHEALQFQGQTGPYLLYTVARINSVLGKASGKWRVASDYGYPETAEKDLINQLARYPELIASLEQSLEPSHVAQYAFDLAQLLNTFYHQCPILQADADVRAARLKLMQASKQVMENALGILGIPVVKEM